MEESTAAVPDGTSQEAPQSTTDVDYNALLDAVPDDVLRKHSRFNGYAGRLAQQMAERERQQIQQQEFERARQEKEAEMLRLAEENPFEFSQKYIKEEGQRKIQLELSSLRTKAQQTLFEKVANAYGALPEWKELTPAEFERIQQQVIGKNDEDLVAAFNLAALDTIANRRANVRSEAAYRDRVAKERAAWEQELRGRALAGDLTPDMTQPMSANAISDVNAIRGMTDRQFQEWYDKNMKR